MIIASHFTRVFFFPRILTFRCEPVSVLRRSGLPFDTHAHTRVAPSTSHTRVFANLSFVFHPTAPFLGSASCGFSGNTSREPNTCASTCFIPGHHFIGLASCGFRGNTSREPNICAICDDSRHRAHSSSQTCRFSTPSRAAERSTMKHSPLQTSTSLLPWASRHQQLCSAERRFAGCFFDVVESLRHSNLVTACCRHTLLQLATASHAAVFWR